MKTALIIVGMACMVAFASAGIWLMRDVHDYAKAQLGTLTAEAKKQSASLDSMDRRIAKSVSDIHDLVIHTDISLNGTHNHPELGLLPNMTLVVRRADGTLADFDSLVRPAAEVLVAGRGTFDAASRNIDSLGNSAGQLASEGGASLSKLNGALDALTADETAAQPVMQHFDSTSANLDASSADVRAFIHRETTPVRGTWNVIKAFLREFAGPAAEVTSAIK